MAFDSATQEENSRIKTLSTSPPRFAPGNASGSKRLRAAVDNHFGGCGNLCGI
jgi:hypothetical protein